MLRLGSHRLTQKEDTSVSQLRDDGSSEDGGNGYGEKQGKTDPAQFAERLDV